MAAGSTCHALFDPKFQILKSVVIQIGRLTHRTLALALALEPRRVLLHECPGSLIGTRAHAVEPQRNAGMVEFVPKLSGTSPNPLIYLTVRQSICADKMVGKRSICI